MAKELWQMLGLYLLTVNLAGFCLLGLDKKRAKRRNWRIKEKALFLPAVLGGAAGCMLGMYFFRHKTGKPRFYVGLPLLTGVQTVLLCWLHLYMR